ncbi:hypothetical protein H8356DRAFT_1081815 [Neocallimastix lanati (nom. inval.)]|nr:hypothetical protein H8356DRAFT_1081815 [Neocallimastix sp. JGI-2020a]
MLQIINLLNVFIILFVINKIQLVKSQWPDSRIEYKTQDEVLNMTKEYKVSFYCKNKICVSANSYYADSTVKLPNEYGIIVEYIIETCNYDQIISNKCDSETYCNYNSECLSNKCFFKNNSNDNNNTSIGYCMFNNQTPIVHCDSIYKAPTVFSGYKSYMYCGKAYRDQCNTDAECSSERCYQGVCQMGSNQMPSDSVPVGDCFTNIELFMSTTSKGHLYDIFLNI